MSVVVEFLKDIVRGVANNIQNRAYNEGIEEGVSNTIRALLYADINDRNIIVNSVRKVWMIDEKEIEDMIFIEKKNILEEIIIEQLGSYGYTKVEIEKFFKENIVKIKLNRDYNLWNLKKSPEKLVKAVEKE